MKQVAIIALVVAAVAGFLMIISIAPMVGVKNSGCEHHPYTSGCR